jgi:integral membrane protein
LGPSQPVHTQRRTIVVLSNPIVRLRLLGLLEGASFLVLLGIAMPLKYLAGQPQMVRVVGAAHGLLFLLFVAAVFDTSLKLRWPLRRVIAALAASVLPFGPFVFDAHLRRTAAPTPIA